MVKRKSSVFSNIYLIMIFIFLYAPILILIINSFNASRFGSVWDGFTFKWYESMLKNRNIVSSLKNTLIVAFVSAGISTVLGTMAAIGIYYMRPKQKAFFQNLAYIPMVNPDIVIGVSLLSLFSLISGLKLGFSTLTLAHVTFCLPYVIFSVMPKLTQLDPNLQEAANDLGATPMQAFNMVILPQIMPGVISGFLMSVTISIDDFIVSFFTTGSGISTLSITVYSMTKRGVSPEINALTTIMFVFLLFMMIINYYRSMRKDVLKKDVLNRS